MNRELINKRIQTLELELAGLKEELNKPSKFESKYIFKECYFIGSSWTSSKMEGTDKKSLENFRYRQTEMNARADLQLQKEQMCIGALAEQIDPDYKSKVIWDAWTQNYFIVYDAKTKEYMVSSRCALSRVVGTIYMPKGVAEKVCQILNNKGVEL